MAKKYLKNEKGIVRAITTDNLQLEKPLLNENYDIEVHNRNMDKIDSAIQEVKGKVDGLELTAQRVSIADSTNKFEATNVEDALLENKTSIQSANSDISALQSSVNTNKTNIANNTNLANQALNKANEAFQRGDNVKTQLVDKLISEGLDVSTNNTFEELIGKIALGKKWASGTGVNVTSIGTDHYYRVHGLSFTPSTILTRTTSGTSIFHGYYISDLLSEKSMAIRGVSTNEANFYMRVFNVDTTSDTATNSYCYNGNFSIKMYGATGNYSKYTFDWIAYE